MSSNLYVHFPFCRRKCTYCALLSRAGSSQTDRDAYVRALADSFVLDPALRDAHLDTVYFGGGSPALCDLSPLFRVLSPHLADGTEFTVELHPLDVDDRLLERLAAGGVNRISLGVQSLDDTTLRDMGRGYALADARRAFDRIRRRFSNAGADFLVGYPGDATRDFRPLGEWGLAHCSIYSLILEECSILGRRAASADGLTLPSDDETMDRIRAADSDLRHIGLMRYEISNYAVPGRECRHNLAVWRGEDYIGRGEGAYGRIGRLRTVGLRLTEASAHPAVRTTTVTPEEDRKERTLFRLRTRDGLDTTEFPTWRPILDAFTTEGLLTRTENVYRLTERGTEVCDSILAELI